MSGQRGNTRKAGLFLGLTFSASWLMAGLFYLLGGRWNTAAAVVVAVAYMFVPMTAAIVVQKLIYREPLRGPLGVSFRPNRWFLVAWLLPLLSPSPPLASACSCRGWNTLWKWQACTRGSGHC